MKPTRIAIRIASFNQPFKKALHTAAQLGASAVEIDARSELRPDELTDTGVRQFRKMMEDLNLRISSIRFQTRRGYDSDDGLDRRVAATKQAMQLAYRLGTDTVVNQIGRVPAERNSDPWHRMASVIDDINRYGAHVGAFLTAETGTESGEDLAALLDHNEESFTPVAFNPGNLIINQHDVASSLRCVADRVRIVCAVDGVRDLAAGRGIEVPLGQGLADFYDIFGCLENSAFSGPIVLQRNSRAGDPVAEIAQAMQYLSNL